MFKTLEEALAHIQKQEEKISSLSEENNTFKEVVSKTKGEHAKLKEQYHDLFIKSVTQPNQGGTEPQHKDEDVNFIENYTKGEYN